MNAASIGIIGGADGPTAVFVTGSAISWIRFSGLIIMFCILLPNILYARKRPGNGYRAENAWLNRIEQLGRYGCMVLMVFPCGLKEFGFPSVTGMLSYYAGNTFLLLGYWIGWILFFRKATPARALALAVLPSAIFLLSGFTLAHWLLVLFAVLFSFAHIRITAQNVLKKGCTD